SILSDVVEALMGAVFLETDYEIARGLVLQHWSDVVDERAEAPGARDYKTRLQEHLARIGLRPVYT
ncbi:MAG: ribonuclease III, partial [Acidobacteria bacterium]|nr:ribonuclease III [Acidobacteriota bacterium]NIQ84728.1 ribonuclease III [Acidobacteriota bacterium]